MTESDSKPWRIDVQAGSFRSDVVERSHQQPVVIDFYADWCRPCQMLAPALEKAVARHAGRVLLAKVDVDQLPEIAGQFGVSSIPAVFALRAGETVDHFVGVLSEPELDRWVEALLPSQGEILLAEARARLQSDPAGAELKLRQAIAEAPELTEARLALVELLWHQRRCDEVRQLLEQLEARGYLEPAVESIKAALAIETGGQQAGGLDACQGRAAAAPDDLPGQFDLARALAAAGQHAEALETCLALVRRDRQQVGQQARELMIDLFRVLPSDSLLTSEYRRKLSTSLY
jgi:putative thioredoxin